MAVDMKKMRGDYNKRQKSGEFWNPDAGDTILYVCPPCRPDDKYEPTEGLNYIPVTLHYQVGKNNAMVMSLDNEANPILDHPFLKPFLKKAKKKLTGRCPMREWLESDEPSEQEADDSRPQTKYLFNVVPIKHRARKGDEWTKLEPQVRPYLSGKMVYDGIMEVFFDEGDVTEMDGAVFIKISKTGKGLNTKYKVSPDVTSLKKPVKLNPKLVKMINEALKEGGDCDLFRMVSNMVKSPSDVEALLSGVQTADDDDDDDFDDDDDTGDEDEGGDDDDDEGDEEEDDEEEPEEDDDDAEEDEEGDDDDEGDDDEEEPEEDEEEDDEEEAEEDEEPEEELPKPKSKAKSKQKASAADLDDDLAALDAELEKVSKKKVSKKAGATKKKVKRKAS